MENGEKNTADIVPVCPKCDKPLKPVEFKEQSPFNKDQLSSMKAGDYFCDNCKGDRGQSAYRYYWKSELGLSENGSAGRNIFGSHYYEGFADFSVRLHFKDRIKYNDFLNWWVLGHEPSKFKLIRPSIMKFAEALEKKMQEHDPQKGDSWKRCPIQVLRTGFVVEYDEWVRLKLDKPKDHDTESKELLDIAAYCVMLWNRFGMEGEKALSHGRKAVCR